MAAVFPANQVIVVGGGLAGMSAANQTVECGGKTVLLDKSSFCGGNSTKATSGINGAATKSQAAQGIPDTVDIFLNDTLKGGAKKPEIAKVLCLNSGADVDWHVREAHPSLASAYPYADKVERGDDDDLPGARADLVAAAECVVEVVAREALEKDVRGDGENVVKRVRHERVFPYRARGAARADTETVLADRKSVV